MPATAVKPNEISIEFRGVTYGVNGTQTGGGLAARETQSTHRESTPETPVGGTGQWDGAGGAANVAPSGQTSSELRGLAANAHPTETKGAATLLLRDVSLTVGAGETLVLLGRSGSGKTTLLRLINRMLTPTAGSVLVQGRATTEWNAFALRRGIGYVIQEAGLFPHFTVAQNIALVPSLENWEESRIAARVQELLQLVGLSGGDFARRYPRQLSGGQRQRVGVARALAADPQILLMDEPFGALDPVTRSELQREFQALVRRLGKTIVFVTHDLREALLLASRIVLLQGGKIVADDTPENFLQLPHPEVRAFATSLQIASQGPAQSSLEGRVGGEHS
jgi:osmoprotectant transport system ATP-binding protein